MSGKSTIAPGEWSHAASVCLSMMWPFSYVALLYARVGGVEVLVAVLLALTEEMTRSFWVAGRMTSSSCTVGRYRWLPEAAQRGGVKTMAR